MRYGSIVINADNIACLIYAKASRGSRTRHVNLSVGSLRQRQREKCD